MKITTFLLLAFLLTSAAGFSQQRSCCGETEAPVKMASFTNDKEFRDAHPDPLPFSMKDEKGKMITFNVSDGLTANGYEIRTEKSSNKWLMVFHEWYGLNDYIKRESDEFFSELGDVNVLAVDLYDGKVASNSEEASKYMKEVDVVRAVNIIKGAMEHAGPEAVFGTLGWCFGGAWSNQAAIILEGKCRACVMYYGMPETDNERLAKLNAPVLGIFAKQDGWITPEVVSKFESDLKKLNKKVEVKMYDAVHAFANPSNPKHDPEATKDAKAVTLRFLKENLK